LLAKEALKDLLSQKELSNTDKLLLCLAVEPARSKAVKDVTQLAWDSGLRSVKKWNVSHLLKGAGERTVRTGTGWELTAKGTEHVSKIAGPLLGSPLPRVASSLRSQLVKITDTQIVDFVEEAIGCLEARHYRAAVVLSWVGAVAVLYDYVIRRRLSDFNTEAAARAAPKHPWKPAKTADDLARMRESDSLNILEKLSIIGASVKKELVKCLDLRNGCGHPNSLTIADHTASSHVEVLLLNVYTKY
jgi:hypothetical protein